MADQTFESAGVRGDPVNHISAIRSAGRGQFLAVDERIFSKGGVHALHQIFVDLAAPIAADFFGEFVAVAERSARINRDDHVTGRSHQLLIPAIAPGIVPFALRAAVNEQQHWIFLARVEIGRPQHQAFYLRASRAFEPKRLRLWQIELRQQSRVLMRNLPHVGTVCVCRENFRGRRQLVLVKMMVCPSWLTSRSELKVPGNSGFGIAPGAAAIE